MFWKSTILQVDLFGMPKIKKIKKALVRIISILLITAGCSLLLMAILATTSLPFWARYQLSSYHTEIVEDINTIVVMGAGGFPSETVLIRLWYTNELAQKYPEAQVVVTTPGDTLDSKSTISQMVKTLTAWGIDSARIVLEAAGLNTRHQALLVKEISDQHRITEPMAIVSSPEHVFRSVRCFEKAGFEKVYGYPANDVMLETNLRIKSEKLGGKTAIPDIGNSISIRYKFWDYLKYEIIVMREYLAIAYYWLNGWM